MAPANYKRILTRTLQLRQHWIGTVGAAARLVGMRTAKDYLELASHCESEAGKVQDKFLCYQLLSFAESYRTLAESTAALERSEEALENMRRKARDRA
jgi:hypothetical protein